MKLTQRTNKILFFLGLSLPLIALMAMSWLALGRDLGIPLLERFAVA